MQKAVFFRHLIVVMSLGLLFSCKVSHQVAGEGPLQKRKYTGGWYRSSEGNPVSKEGITQNEFKASGALSPIEPLPFENLPLVAATKEELSIQTEESDVKCDTVVLTTGEKRGVKIIEIGEKKVRYKKCASQDGPDYFLKKEEIEEIRYPDGSKEVFTEDTGYDPYVMSENEESGEYDNEDKSDYSRSGESEEDDPEENVTAGYDDEPKLEPFSLISFFAALTGLTLLFLIGFPFFFGSAAVVFGIIGMVRHYKDNYKGKGFMISGFAIGILTIALFWILILFAPGA